MKKILIIIACILCCSLVRAQRDTAKLILPIKDSLVFYESIISTQSEISKDLLYNSIIEWCASQYKDSNDAIKLNDKPAGEIVGNGSFYGNTKGLLGATYTFRYTFKIEVKDGKCRMQLNHFLYDLVSDRAISYKPVEPRYFSSLKLKGYNYKQEKAIFSILKVKAIEVINSLETFVKAQTKDTF